MSDFTMDNDDANIVQTYDAGTVYGDSPLDSIKQNLIAGFTFGDNYLEVEDWVDETTWVAFGQMLQKVPTKWRWYVADWLAFGNHNYGDEAYKQAADILGGSQKTWEDYAYIGRNVQFSERSEILPFIHHKHIAPYDTNLQRNLIAIAEQHKLSEELFKAIIPLYIAGDNYTHLLPGTITPIARARLKSDKQRNSILNKAKGKRRAEWLTFAQQEAAKWAELASTIKHGSKP